MIHWKNILLVASLVFLAACSLDGGDDQAAVSSLSTQVNAAINATRAAQAEIAENIRNTELAWTATPSSTPSPLPSDTPAPTATYTPSPTMTASPSLTPSQTPSATPTDTQVPLGYITENVIVFYLTHIGTGGPIGCGDSLVKLSTGQIKTGDLATDLKIALDTIFTAGQYAGSLYNATYPSQLRVSGVDFNKSSGVAEVQLSGSYQKPADACDASRYRSQVWATALQFDEITRFIPWVGDSLLGDRLAVYKDSGK